MKLPTESEITLTGWWIAVVPGVACTAWETFAAFRMPPPGTSNIAMVKAPLFAIATVVVLWKAIKGTTNPPEPQ